MSVVGTWILKSFTISPPGEATRDWGANTRGTIIYGPQYVSVAINKDIVGDTNNAQNILDSLLFYSGTYRVDENRLFHEVKVASDPTRVGKTLERTFRLEGKHLIIEGRGEFGSATIVWQKP